MMIPACSQTTEVADIRGWMGSEVAVQDRWGQSSKRTTGLVIWGRRRCRPSTFFFSALCRRWAVGFQDRCKAGRNIMQTRWKRLSE